MKVGQVTFGRIKNVRKSGDEEGVYFADVEISFEDGFPFEWCLYCARADDFAATGRWVYSQLVIGAFEGEVAQLAPGANPETGEVPQQPVATGVQTL